jgi:hypothetical protein
MLAHGDTGEDDRVRPPSVSLPVATVAPEQEDRLVACGRRCGVSDEPTPGIHAQFFLRGLDDRSLRACMELADDRRQLPVGEARQDPDRNEERRRRHPEASEPPHG